MNIFSICWNYLDQWLTDELLKHVASNPVLMKGMSNPHFMQAIDDFQKNPSEAMIKYKDNAAVQHFLKEFTGIMGKYNTTDYTLNFGSHQILCYCKAFVAYQDSLGK